MTLKTPYDGETPMGVPIDEYMKVCDTAFKDLDKRCPVLWKYMLKKRYVVPGYRAADYYPQKLIDYIGIDQIFSYLKGEIDLGDHVSAHLMNSLVTAMHFDRPTLWLEKELGFPLMKTKLPPDFYLADLHWRWPTMRVFLPKGLLTIKRNGIEDSMMFIDLTYVKANLKNDFPVDLSNEIRAKFPGYKKVPVLYSAYDGMAVTGMLAMDGSQGPVGYATSTKFDRNTIINLVTQLADRIASPTPVDELDEVFLEKMLGVGLNILMYMGTLPAESFPTPEVLRKPCTEGKRSYSGLYAARFVGESQFRTPHVWEGEHTGRHLPAHWRAGHWKRVPVGKGKLERRLTWINLYQTHGQDVGSTPV